MTGAERAADVDLDAIEQRANDATEGPWSFYAGTLWSGTTADELARADAIYASGVAYSDEAEDIIERSGQLFYGDPKKPADAEFIAHARTDVPALVAAVRAERARADEAEAEVERLTRELIKATRHERLAETAAKLAASMPNLHPESALALLRHSLKTFSDLDKERGQ